MNDKTIVIRVRGREQSLKVGSNYFFEFRNPEKISFNLHCSEVMDIHWRDSDNGKVFFFIYVHAHNEDYLISDNEIVTAKLADLVVGKVYEYIMDNGSLLTGELIEVKYVGEVIHSIWIDIGRQPVYLDYKEIAEIIELDSDLL